MPTIHHCVDGRCTIPGTLADVSGIDARNRFHCWFSAMLGEELFSFGISNPGKAHFLSLPLLRGSNVASAAADIPWLESEQHCCCQQRLLI